MWLPPRRAISGWPAPTQKYYEDRAPIDKKFEAARAPHWARFMTGEITHAQYCALIAPATKAYITEVSPVWEKHGGKKQ